MKNSALLSLKVMGHRTSKEAGNTCNNLNRLVALDSVTLEPVEAVWRYDEETSGSTGSGFIDITSQKALNVSAEGYNTVTLRPVNISRFQNYYFDGFITNAMLVVKDDHTIDGWGPEFPDLPVPAEQNHDVTILHPGDECAVALRSDHSIFSWGNPENGGELKIKDATRTDVLDIQMAGGMGLLQGTTIPVVSQWGKDSDGTNKVPDEVSSRTDIRKVLTNGAAQIALTTSGQILEWGTKAEFILPPRIAALTDVEDIYINFNAGVVLRKTGQLEAWGIPQTGGSLPDEIAALTDVARVIPGTESFVALRTNGAIVCWGQDFALPESMKSLTGIVHVVYGMSQDVGILYEGCAAYDSNGQVYSWYGPGMEGTVPEGLSNVVALTYNAFTTFAALKSDGSVVAWGEGVSADTSPVDSLLNNVLAIYPETQGYLALKSDGSLVAWGDRLMGSDNASIPANLQGRVTYQYPLAQA